MNDESCSELSLISSSVCAKNYGRIVKKFCIINSNIPKLLPKMSTSNWNKPCSGEVVGVEIVMNRMT